MSYEFEDVDLEIIMHENDFDEFVEKLREEEGTAWMPDELYIEKEGYCGLIYEDNFNKEEFHNLCYLKIKHRGCFKWYNIKKWLSVFNQYCLGDMCFTGDFGEFVLVEFRGKENYEIEVSEHRVIPEKDWNDGFKDHFYDRVKP